MYDETHFTHDAAVVEFHDDAEGITVDDDGDVSFDWDDVETVTVDDPPHSRAFDSKEFYRLPATVARPIRQPYRSDSGTVWLKKPRDELKRAAWSLDNKPWTMGHPNTTLVRNVDDVRGFWDDTKYHDSVDDLDSNLHVPVNDDEAKEFIEENDDVSVGFYNRVARVDEYDGVVGGSDDDDDDVDGYQIDMYFDHCASVKTGRCSGEEGCGIDAARPHGHMSFISDGRTTSISRDEGDSTPMESDLADNHVVSSGVEMNHGFISNYDISPGDGSASVDAYRDEDGRYFAVAPDENPDGEPKFPINNCSDVGDAWQLRNHGDIGISVETLEERIKRRASDLDCEDPEGESDSADDCGCDDDTITIERTLHIHD